MNRYLFNGCFGTDDKSVDNEAYKVINIDLIKNQKLEFGLHDKIKNLVKDKISPTELGLDFMILGMMVYIADTKVNRELDSQDTWTREFALIVPVSDVEKWRNSKEIVSQMLNFLTGDKWNVSFKERDVRLSEIIEPSQDSNSEIDTVTLFSGGMDSLISTINFLEQKKKLLLISHAGDNYTTNVQNSIVNSFDDKYPDSVLKRLYWRLIFSEEIVPNSKTENSTRSRSFLFISMGILAITGLKEVNKLYVPENGYIAMNVPLDRLRLGSLSTKTTHPFYLSMWNKLLGNIGIGKEVVNEYILLTKGEMAESCLNKEFLKYILPSSISCSAPSKHRWSGAKSMHCGHCVPCIIRRAAMNNAFGDDTETEYFLSDINDALNNTDNQTGANYRSFQLAIDRIKKNVNIANKLIYKPGPISTIEYGNELAQMYIRGLKEVEELIKKYCEDK